MNTVLVVGASGYFGRLLIEELLLHTQARIVAAGRHRHRLEQCAADWQDGNNRVELAQVDLAQISPLSTLVQNANVAICAAGPFQDLPSSLLELCLDKNVHYIDLSDCRSFVLRSHAIARSRTTEGKALPVVCSGWSAVPALSAALAKIAIDAGKSTDGKNKISHSAAPGSSPVVQTIRIQIAPGNRAPRSDATIASLLCSLGQSFQIWHQDRWIAATGWSDRYDFDFPPPLGRRPGYLVDVPDHELFPELFQASSVEFRVGAELQFLNWICSGAAALSRSGLVKNWRPLLPLIKVTMQSMGGLGHDWGGLGVECTLLPSAIDENESPATIRVSVTAPHHGQFIPVLPAVVMTGKLLGENHNLSGIISLSDWISASELELECKKRNYQLQVCEGRGNVQQP